MHDINTYWLIILFVSSGMFIFFLGIRLVPQTHRGIIEFMGKYSRFVKPGIHWIIPGIEKMITINIKEQMMYTEPQEIVTDDKKNVKVSTLVYFKVKEDKFSVLKFRYEYNKYYEWRVINLAQKTLKSVIGKSSLASLQTGISLINKELQNKMSDEALYLGVNILRTDIMEMEDTISIGNMKEFAEDNFPATTKTFAQ